MGENSAIEWTECTFNPWMGCTKVSGACKHCYAETLMDARYGKVQWGPKGLRQRTSASNWRKPLTWNRRQRQWREAAEAAGVPYQRPRVFCASLADVFEGADTMSAESRPVVEQARLDLWALVEATPELDWLLLTKRPKNVVGMVPEAWVGCGECGHRAFSTHPCPFCDSLTAQWPSNVWLGTTVEDQPEWEKRRDAFLAIPAGVRFVSAEPLLSGLEFTPSEIRAISWVIAGGESGHGARPSHPDWFRSLRDQCVEAGVPFLFKQWGAWRDDTELTRQECLSFGGEDRVLASDGRVVGSGFGRKGFLMEEACEGDGGLRVGYAWMSKVGKKAAGRLLDGRTWDEVPRT